MKKVVSLIMVLCLLPYISVKADTLVVNSDNIELASKAKSAILLEASTGEIIFEKNSHEKLDPASMTKMMGMLLVMESIEKGLIKWNDKVTASENASNMGGSQILLEVNEQMTVSDLFKGVAIASGNDAIVALGEKIAGTEDAFVNMMNNRSKELGLKNTNFKNPHGLDDANHYSSAYDMAIIAKELVKYDKVLEYSAIYEDYLRKGTKRETWLVNTNKLVRFYQGVDGLKTGYTSKAGYCLTATAKKSGMRLIAVVMGEPDSKIRNAEVSSMLDYGFNQYALETLVNKNNKVGLYQVNKAKNKYVEIVPKEDVTVLFKKMGEKKKSSYSIDLYNLKAPIKKGDKVGFLTLKENNTKLRTIDLTVKQDVKKANILELYLSHLKDILSGNINL